MLEKQHVCSFLSSVSPPQVPPQGQHVLPSSSLQMEVLLACWLQRQDCVIEKHSQRKTVRVNSLQWIHHHLLKTVPSFYVPSLFSIFKNACDERPSQSFPSEQGSTYFPHEKIKKTFIMDNFKPTQNF